MNSAQMKQANAFVFDHLQNSRPTKYIYENPKNRSVCYDAKKETRR